MLLKIILKLQLRRQYQKILLKVLGNWTRFCKVFLGVSVWTMSLP
uniref:Uncharacterized protein n=1 Tax=Arundo donax TaxID=35708 RepID=A0A0A9G1U0_ARUDO